MLFVVIFLEYNSNDKSSLFSIIYTDVNSKTR